MNCLHYDYCSTCQCMGCPEFTDTRAQFDYSVDELNDETYSSFEYITDLETAAKEEADFQNKK